MDPKSLVSKKLEVINSITDRSSADIHPGCNIIENGDLFEDDFDPVLNLDSLKEDTLIGRHHIRALEQTLGLIDSILQPINSGVMSANGSCLSPEDSGSLRSGEKRPKSFLHDEMDEFNQIFSELVSTRQPKFPCRYPSPLCSGTQFLVSSKELSGKLSDFDSVGKPNVCNDENVGGLFKNASCGFDYDDACKSCDVTSAGNSDTCRKDSMRRYDNVILHNSDFTLADCSNRDARSSGLFTAEADKIFTSQNREMSAETQLLGRRSFGNCCLSDVSDAGSSFPDGQGLDFASLSNLQFVCAKCEKIKVYEPMNEEDADSGYQTGDSSVPAMVSAAKKLERVASVSRDHLLQRIEKFNSNKLGLTIGLRPDSNVYEGNIRVHLNIFRPIKMCLSSRPSSIYDILVRTDARLPEIESDVSFFQLPRNTFKSIHISSETTTNTVIKTLLNKFNVTDNPKRFALYERIMPDEDAKKALKDAPQLSNTLSFVRRLADDDQPLELCLCWADHGMELLDRCQFVLQENDPGEITWEDFSLPELNSFLRILSKEEHCYADQIRTKYRLLRHDIEKRLQSFENAKKST